MKLRLVTKDAVVTNYLIFEADFIESCLHTSYFCMNYVLLTYILLGS